MINLFEKVMTGAIGISIGLYYSGYLKAICNNLEDFLPFIIIGLFILSLIVKIYSIIKLGKENKQLEKEIIDELNE